MWGVDSTIYCVQVGDRFELKLINDMIGKTRPAQGKDMETEYILQRKNLIRLWLLTVIEQTRNQNSQSQSNHDKERWTKCQQVEK